MLTQAKRNGFTFIIIGCISLSFPLLSVSQGWGKESVEKETSSYIEQLKNDDDWRKRSQAASALGEMGSEPAIPALITALKTEQDEVVRLRATFALIKIGSPAIPSLIETLKHENASARYSATFALSQMSSLAFPSLTEALQSEHELIHTNAASAIAKIAENRTDKVERLSTSDLVQAISNLEQAQNRITSFQAIEENINPVQAGFKQEDIETIRDSLTILNAERRDRILSQTYLNSR
ncbi:PBS lyase HEAT-like repeat domain protein [Coleofasciculus chthonoplastes PCC 7420]|uniref:PBS lyase HEAT-like repeat domain protein n=1 Tax=Coleofasciculus chthonoplastes PCC 7420 TaxID=118168 RepID=B4VXD6_9CYAN|nr:HEAT repeat domain-containing protein [Coleofasciculus chthonoplastes]EDX73331.1 PBS lyase HEAT-like repeat domain protein [Coleofasciculus chthonoplastes PCC 7420]